MRVRLCTPVPQVLVQRPHGAQLETLQWMGQRPLLHSAVWKTFGQTLPPNCGRVLILRARVRLPMPHVSEHADHAPKEP